MRNVVLLGSTGSIGTSTIKVAEDLPDRIRLLALAAGNNAELLLDQTRKHQPEAISLADPAKARELRDLLGTTTEVFSGAEGLVRLATLPAADIVLIAIVGTAGLAPALAAGNTIVFKPAEDAPLIGGEMTSNPIVSNSTSPTSSVTPSGSGRAPAATSHKLMRRST